MARKHFARFKKEGFISCSIIHKVSKVWLSFEPHIDGGNSSNDNNSNNGSNGGNKNGCLGEDIYSEIIASLEEKHMPRSITTITTIDKLNKRPQNPTLKPNKNKKAITTIITTILPPSYHHQKKREIKNKMTLKIR